VPPTAVAKGTPSPSPSPTVPPVADPAVTKVARQQFVAWQAGAVDRNLYAPELAAKMTDDKIADVSRHIGPLGALLNTTYIGPFVGADFPSGARGYIYQMLCSNGNVYEWMVIGADGKLATIYFRDTLTTEDVEAPAPSPT
jgi:hypothetical protein